MNVLLLGSKGMLGRQLAEVFNDEDLVSWDKEDIDITKEDEVRRKIVGQQPEIIINAAAYTDVDQAEREKTLAFTVNETGVKNIAKVAKDIGATMVHFSTDYVFRGDSETGYAENDPPGPAVNVYGESKLAGERILKEIGPNFFLIRTAWLYGPGGNNFVDTMLRLADTKDKIEVVDDQHGNPTYTKDLAEATKRLIAGDYEFGIYHLVNKGTVTWYGLAHEIFRKTGREVEVKPVTSADFVRLATRPKWSVLKSTAGLSLRKWQAGLIDYLKTKLANRDGNDKR